MEHNSTSWLLPGMRAAGERPISWVPPPPGERCAVCFAGLDKQEPYQAGRNIRENLIDRLGADVLLALTQLIKEDEGGGVNCTKQPSFRDCPRAHDIIREKMHGLMPITAIQLRPTSSTPQLVRMLEATPHWNTTLMDRISWSGCKRDPNWQPCKTCPPTPYTGCKLGDYGNSFFSPVLNQGPPRHVLQELESQSGCLALIAQHERANGFTYSRVVFSRLQYHWLHPHPPLTTLARDNYLWVPSNENYGGLNDRHGVFSREMADAYLGRFNMLLDGRILWVDPWMSDRWNGTTAAGTPASRFHLTSSERYLMMVAHSHNWTIGKFPSTMYMVCCTGICNTKACHGASMPTGGQYSMQLHGKYPIELLAAVTHAIAASLPGVTYARPVLDFGHRDEMVRVHFAIPREQYQAFDCNISAVHPGVVRENYLAGATIRWVGPWPGWPMAGMGPPRFSWDLPCPEQKVIELLGEERARRLPLKASAPTGKSARVATRWGAWIQAIIGNEHAANVEANLAAAPPAAPAAPPPRTPRHHGHHKLVG